jgi:hypothetical protein
LARKSSSPPNWRLTAPNSPRRMTSTLPSSAAALVPAWIKPRRDLFTAPSRTALGCGFPQGKGPEHRKARQTKKVGMNVHLAQNAVEGLFGAPLPVQKAFIKRINFLVRNLNHSRFAPRSLTRVRAVGGPASMTTVRFLFHYRRRHLPHQRDHAPSQITIAIAKRFTEALRCRCLHSIEQRLYGSLDGSRICRWRDPGEHLRVIMQVEFGTCRRGQNDRENQLASFFSSASKASCRSILRYV